LRTKTRILSFTIIILASLFTISFIDNPIFAEKEGSIINATITIFPDEAVLNAGETRQIILLIDNSENNNLINVEKISILPWSSTLDKAFVVTAKSSETETIDITIPADTSPGKYSLVISVEDSLGKIKTASSKLTVEQFKPLEFSWILGLLGAYLIPAQIIERIIEPIKNRRNRLTEFHKGIENLTEELTFWKKMRTTIINVKIENIKTAKMKAEKKKIGDLAEKDSIETGLVEETKRFYHDALEQLNQKIDEISKSLSKEKVSKAMKMWQYGVVFAIPIGILFSYYSIGILQIMGYNGFEFIVYDAIINTLFIGSGTKPIHDIIGILVKGKEAREGKLKDT